MSDSTTGQEPESLDLGTDPAAAMGDILRFLAPEADEPAPGTGDPADDGAAAGTGQQQPEGEGAGGAGGADVAPAAGDVGVGGVSTEAGAPLPGVGEVDATSLNDSWGEIANGFETSQASILEASALAESREEHANHFDFVEKHPRELVGVKVPNVTTGEMEVLRDAADAESWQSAVKRLLVQDVRARAAAKADDLRGTFETVHASIDLFRNNVDLIPGTKQFDGELAKQFVEMAKDYELRSDGKLVGYSVPVQPLINQLRAKIAAQRTAAPAAPSAQQQRAAEQPRTPAGQFDGPQAGLSSRAGSSGGGTNDEAADLLGAFARQNGITL